MKCTLAYPWVKLPRAHIPAGKGIMASFLRLASRAAFRTGYATYCGHVNAVQAGSWAGGIVGVKSILGCDKSKAMNMLEMLNSAGYITYTLDKATKKLTYTIVDWVSGCNGAACAQGTIYTTEGYGFLCIPRDITRRLVEVGYVFDEVDAWLDLWCHSVWGDRHNAFSRLCPTVQFSRQSPVLTLEKIGKRWGWGKSKTWRFLHKYSDTFALYKLPGSYGCIIFNRLYPTAYPAKAPTDAEIKRIVDAIRIMGGKTYYGGNDHEHFNKMTLWYSSRVCIGNLNEKTPSTYHPALGSRVSLSRPNTRAYISPKCYIYQETSAPAYSYTTITQRITSGGLSP